MSEPAWIGNEQDVALAKGRPYSKLPDVPRVFEVTDLVIPAGTDWSSLGHVLGTVTVGPGDLVQALALIEVADVPGGTDWVNIVAEDNPDWQLSAAWIAASVDPTNDLANEKWKRASVADLWAEVVPAPVFTATPPVATELTVSLHGQASADITVVRARAAFLVI